MLESPWTLGAPLTFHALAEAFYQGPMTNASLKMLLLEGNTVHTALHVSEPRANHLLRRPMKRLNCEVRYVETAMPSHTHRGIYLLALQHCYLGILEDSMRADLN